MYILFSLIFLLFPPLLIFALSLRKDHYCSDEKFWQRQNWKLSEIAILLFIISLIQISGYFLFKYNIFTSAYSYEFLNFLLRIVILSGVYIYLFSKHSFNFKLVGIDSNKILFKASIGFCAFLAYSGLVVGLSILTKRPHLITDRADDFFTINFHNFPLFFKLIYIFSLVVIAPLLEEFFFRGLIYGPLQRKVGVGWGIVACSFVWALGHNDLRYLGGVFFIGLILCFLYKQTKSLIPGMVMHSLLNMSNLFIYVYIVTRN